MILLQLRCQQMLTYCHVSYCVHVANECERQPALDQSQTESTVLYVLVALRLMQLTILNETDVLYYNKVSMAES